MARFMLELVSWEMSIIYLCSGGQILASTDINRKSISAVTGSPFPKTYPFSYIVFKNVVPYKDPPIIGKLSSYF